MQTSQQHISFVAYDSSFLATIRRFGSDVVRFRFRISDQSSLVVRRYDSTKLRGVVQVGIVWIGGSAGSGAGASARLQRNNGGVTIVVASVMMIVAEKS
jgi:hypothetical protein